MPDMSLPYIYDDAIGLYRGDSARLFTFELSSQDPPASDPSPGPVVPVNLIAVYGVDTFAAQWRTLVADTSALATLTVDASDATGGILHVDITPADWELVPLTLARGWVDVQGVATDGTIVKTFAAAKVKVLGDRTR